MNAKQEVQSSDPLAPRSSWEGSLDLVYRREGQQTQISHCYHQAPFNLQRPFYPEGPQVCHTVALHTAGGVVGGDRLSIQIALQPQTHVLLTTAAASKIYRSNGQEARQSINFQIQADAMLEWLPLETILFDQADYRQDLHIDLEPGAIYSGWEITRLGRSARGEKFLSGSWRSNTEIWQQQQPLWIDRQRLSGGTEQWHSPHGLAAQPVVASFVWVGEAVDLSQVSAARLLWQTNPENLGDIGVTRLQLGLLCRYRGFSSQAARQWFIQVWNLMRLARLGRRACLPRVWPI
ncbi:MAG: urease accessory protein UreD [Acaryochloridaceae cyanobacterium SU_2_1]|nr:urease accessory protein UreD [Acaryochloridaceae cyanobacterium SU_2_1]